MVKLTLGVDFTNMLLATFMYAETEGAKNTIYFTFFAFLASVCVKAAH